MKNNGKKIPSNGELISTSLQGSTHGEAARLCSDELRRGKGSNGAGKLGSWEAGRQKSAAYAKAAARQGAPEVRTTAINDKCQIPPMK